MNDKNIDSQSEYTQFYNAQILSSIQIIGSIKQLVLTLLSAGVDAYCSWAFKLNIMGLIPMCCFTIFFYI